MPAQKIFGLDTRQAQHFGDLIERQSLLAVTFERERFQHTTRDVATGDRQAFSDVIWNAEDHFHAPSLTRGNAISHFPVGAQRESGVSGSERILQL
jgi:hypothetical protein